MMVVMIRKLMMMSKLDCGDDVDGDVGYGYNDDGVNDGTGVNINVGDDANSGDGNNIVDCSDDEDGGGGVCTNGGSDSDFGNRLGKVTNHELVEIDPLMKNNVLIQFLM